MRADGLADRQTDTDGQTDRHDETSSLFYFLFFFFAQHTTHTPPYDMLPHHQIYIYMCVCNDVILPSVLT